MQLPALLAKLLVVIVSISLFTPTITSLVTPTHAAPLAEAMIRLDRLNNNSSVSGIACARASSAGAGTEGRVAITFPTDFSISTNTNSWITSISDLPSGSTAWPGISATAVSVSGKTVTFGSNDLTTGNLYCFQFNATGSTTGATGAKTGSITTLTAGNSQIDTRSYGLTITDDRLNVSAIVPAQPSDFEATITRITPGNPFSQNEEIIYEVSYRSLLGYTTNNVTVEAEWDLGTVQGAGVPTVNTVSYVLGSAENAYNNTPATVDLSNRRIQWNIGAFPGNTSGKVRFTLVTNNAYQGGQPVTFPVTARVLGPGTASPDSTISTTYLYDDGVTPTPTSGPTTTSGPEQSTTQNPTPSITVTDTPTPSRTAISFTDVTLQSVSSTTANVLVSLSQPGSLSVQYGTSQQALTEQLTALTPFQTHTLSFSDLARNTTYYFRITATGIDGSTITSDLFTFTTASSLFLPKINTNSFIVTSEKNLIFSFLDKPSTGGENIIILPPNTLFEIQFAFDNSSTIKEVQLLLRQRNVLGSSTFIKEVEASDNQTPMLEIKPGVYTGRLESKTEPGYYELVIRTSDTSGNINEEKLSDVKISKAFRILTEGSNDSVENARVSLSLYNDRLRSYQEISEQVLPIENPVYSDPDGTVPIVLPAGKYRAVIDSLGYEEKQIDFTIGTNLNEDYPTVYIKKAPFNVLYGAQYFLTVADDITSSFSEYLGQINGSKRLFNFTATIIVSIFLLLTTLSLSHRMHTHPRHLPRYFLSLLTLHKGEIEKERHYQGIVILANSINPIPGVDIFITDHATGKIVFHTKTNARGEFHVDLPPKDNYLITLEKISYHPVTTELKLFNKDEIQTFALLMESSKIHTLKEDLAALFHAGMSLSFELFLLLSIISTIILSFSLGLFVVLPFLALAVGNMVFWMLHTIHHQT